MGRFTIGCASALKKMGRPMPFLHRTHRATYNDSTRRYWNTCSSLVRDLGQAEVAASLFITAPDPAGNAARIVTMRVKTLRQTSTRLRNLLLSAKPRPETIYRAADAVASCALACARGIAALASAVQKLGYVREATRLSAWINTAQTLAAQVRALRASVL